MAETLPTPPGLNHLPPVGEKSRLLYDLLQSAAGEKSRLLSDLLQSEERVVMVLDGGTVLKLEVLLSVVVVILALLALLLILLALM